MEPSEGRRLALLLEYDGTGFAGSQFQPAARTVQGAVEAALEQFTGERQRVAFAGRTDAGVHASGQVAALTTATSYGLAAFRDALNHFLPEDVAVRAAAEVAAGFDPRRHARSRRYRYRVMDGQKRSPLERHRAWQVEHPLDVSAMAAAVALLPRENRDWAAFGGAVPEGYPTVRTLLHAEVERTGPNELVVVLEADGFLPHQVRLTVGTLWRVGSGKLTPSQFAEMVDGPPASAGPAAPPQGLTLIAVRYAPGAVDWGT
ncbi:MAG: tRNA pseudouridine(38-40) synthase TruA [Dehalococcoidia bacterium]|nr:tRNA pseudouridine(38-40) synthase TruA [Dehalococcoidia bacterium]